MARKTIFTKEEDKKIINHILNNPGNIAKACKELSITLNQKQSTIANRWYKKLSKDTDKCFTIYGRKKHSLNRKNVDTMISHKISLWTKVLQLIHIK